MFEFTLTGRLAGRGRTGTFHTPHGDIQTPVFMPVGTNATVKSLSPEQLVSIGSQIILANNYHLYLRPGSDKISSLGGIHRFMNWPKPVLTDSGGFQVFSLGEKPSPPIPLSHQQLDLKDPNLIQTNDSGVEFRSHHDGSRHFFTPEAAIDSQVAIGADIIMALDVCTPDQAPLPQAELALKRTHDWLLKCQARWQNTSANQALFGIIQGAMHKSLRRQSAEFVASAGLPGIAIGGETIGYNMDGTEEVMEWIADLLPENKPRYTMGLGLRPSDIVRAVLAGADMFDCVAPTRLARNGALYTGSLVTHSGHPVFESDSDNERIDIAKAVYADDPGPIDSGCDCPTCSQYSRAYLHHLFKSKELLFYSLASVHNLRMMIKVTEDLRKMVVSPATD